MYSVPEKQRKVLDHFILPEIQVPCTNMIFGHIIIRSRVHNLYLLPECILCHTGPNTPERRIQSRNPVFKSIAQWSLMRMKRESQSHGGRRQTRTRSLSCNASTFLVFRVKCRPRGAFCEHLCSTFYLPGTVSITLCKLTLHSCSKQFSRCYCCCFCCSVVSDSFQPQEL